MKLKIWVDEEGTRHTSLDGMEIGNIITGLNLYNRSGKLSEVELIIMPALIEVELDAQVEIILDGEKYHLKSIKRN